MEINVFGIVLASLLMLMLSLAENNDSRRPMSTKLRYKYRVKDDSVFRKIIKFKDKENIPCNYFKIVPIYVYLFMSIVSTILFAIDKFAGGIITSNIDKSVLTIATIFVYGSYLVYLLSIVIWWELVDHKFMKLTEEEKEEFKRLQKKKSRK